MQGGHILNFISGGAQGKRPNAGTVAWQEACRRMVRKSMLDCG
jgi:hypothetical protein